MKTSVLRVGLFTVAVALGTAVSADYALAEEGGADWFPFGLSLIAEPTDSAKVGIGRNRAAVSEEPLYVEGTYPVDLKQDTGALVLGHETSYNLAIDGNEITARRGNSRKAQFASPLHLNADGGSVIVHGHSSLPSRRGFRIDWTGNVSIGTRSVVGGFAKRYRPRMDQSLPGGKFFTFSAPWWDHNADKQRWYDIGYRYLNVNGGIFSSAIATMWRSNFERLHVGEVIGENGKYGLPSWEGTLPSGEQPRLTVAGVFATTELVVSETNWADFVLHPDYKLQPLSEVMQYVEKEGHLPGVPSASEAEKNGVGIGFMNGLLLQKVEELTLHKIGHQYEIDDMEQKLETLERLAANAATKAGVK